MNRTGQVVALKTPGYSCGASASGMTVPFAVDGVTCGSAVATASGASLSYTIPLAAAPGTHSVTVSSAGDSGCNADTDDGGMEAVRNAVFTSA